MFILVFWFKWAQFLVLKTYYKKESLKCLNGAKGPNHVHFHKLYSFMRLLCGLKPIYDATIKLRPSRSNLVFFFKKKNQENHLNVRKNLRSE